MDGKVLEQATAHAVAEFPRESCGLVVRTDGGDVYVPCSNVATTPSEHFVMGRDDVARAEALGEVVELVHSHPGHPARPSEGDLASCEATGLRWTILRTDRDESTGLVAVTEAHSWEPNGWSPPLVGRALRSRPLSK